MNINKKYENFDNLVKIINTLREIKKDQIIAYCHGCYDFLHIGHIKHLQESKNFSNEYTTLIVTITPDIFINKGLYRPIFNETLRAEAIASLECVDYVAVNKWPTAVEAIKLLKPNLFIKGVEYQHHKTQALIDEETAIQSIGGKLVFAGNMIFSTTELLRRLRG